MKILTFLSVVFYHRFKIIKTTDDAISKKLIFDSNVFGDNINRYNCRSFWYDEYGFRYRCSELYIV